VPSGVTEDRLLGSVDVAASLASGTTVFQPGLLAEAHRGVLYIDELNLLDDGITNLLLAAVGSGVNRIEREGLSLSHPCRVPADRHLQPRGGGCARPPAGSLCHRPLGQSAAGQRAAGGDHPLRPGPWGGFQQRFGARWQEETDALATQLLLARQWLPDVVITAEQITIW
jgi:magnesium chelatase subunit D